MVDKVLIIIPVYNEEETISEVICEIKKHLSEADILVVDDGSSDSSARWAEKEANYCIRLPFHLGLGAALQTGYLFAWERDYDFVVHFDADGQHIASEIEKIIQPVKKGECDIAIGSRFADRNNVEYNMPFSRRLASSLISGSFYLLVHRPIKDPTSGFRAMNKKVLSLFSQYYPSDYPEVEELLLLANNNLKIKEIPIKMRSRLKGKSSLTLRKSIFYMFKVVLVLLLDSFWVIKLSKLRRVNQK